MVGVYRFDPFQGVLKVIFTRENNAKFPKKFTIDKLTILKPKELSTEEWKAKTSKHEGKDDKETGMEDFIKNSLLKHDANPSFAPEIAKLLNKQNVGKI